MKYLTIPIFVIVGVLLATAMIAPNYHFQTVKAQTAPGKSGTAYGTFLSQFAGPDWGPTISACATGAPGNQCSNTVDSNGMSGQRAAGCTPTGNGQSDQTHGSIVCGP